ncbi:MAG: nucleoid-associated protein [Deltaproteobacteria bacterium]|mgnify:CR=1 FL=1|jgi:DNA-binding YbaB/EbfC family protein|nr:Nucleoid-associated protein [bacterium HR37]GIW48466.1 MAG: nucleoid-associated protein [Deltaproteobacteria bacterium]
MKFGGNIQNMLKQAEKVKEQLEKLQAEAGEKIVEASAGGGMVVAVAKAKGEIVSIKIEPEIIKEGDIEMLQDLITAAVNEALNRGREVMKEEIAKVASGFGLPPGLI